VGRNGGNGYTETYEQESGGVWRTRVEVCGARTISNGVRTISSRWIWQRLLGRKEEQVRLRDVETALIVELRNVKVRNFVCIS
jgi:hypothetical protein